MPIKIADTSSWSEHFATCTRFLNHEAELLDNNQMYDWLGLLSDDINYRIPVRLTQERTTESDFSDESFHLNEDYAKLKARVDRLETEYDWSEDPPSRTRRIVSNIRIDEGGADEIECKSNIMLYRSRGDTSSYDLLVGERHDQLSNVENGWELSNRRILLDQTILNTHNLAIFL